MPHVDAKTQVHAESVDDEAQRRSGREERLKEMERAVPSPALRALNKSRVSNSYVESTKYAQLATLSTDVRHIDLSHEYTTACVEGIMWMYLTW
jgi:hypothetical protein